ncbi:hypothetical protein E2C01_028805 [Portunus trituberculatus]|uniref:Uncharacterized protein n=1 Tax=Portunus trituberculatus TaxID=210409 RepID=A0A5B7ESU1_PORTR|nr:hypothetical protein [Portunus trituberculatus]
MSDVPCGPARSSLPCLPAASGASLYLTRRLLPGCPRCLPLPLWLRRARSSVAERHRHVRCHTRRTPHAPRGPRHTTGTHYKSIALIQQRKYPEPRPEGRHVRFLYSAEPIRDAQPRRTLVRTCAAASFAHLRVSASIPRVHEPGTQQCHHQARSGEQSDTRAVTSLDWCRCVPLFVNYFPA